MPSSIKSHLLPVAESSDLSDFGCTFLIQYIAYFRKQPFNEVSLTKHSSASADEVSHQSQNEVLSEI